MNDRFTPKDVKLNFTVVDSTQVKRSKATRSRERVGFIWPAIDAACGAEFGKAVVASIPQEYNSDSGRKALMNLSRGYCTRKNKELRANGFDFHISVFYDERGFLCLEKRPGTSEGRTRPRTKAGATA